MTGHGQNPAAPPRRHDATILVCDRDDGGLAAWPEMLESLGFSCDYAVDAHEDPPDAPAPALLLVPAEIPGGPEGDAFRRLRRHYPLPRLAVVARNRNFAELLAFLRAGADDYFAQPFDPDEIAARLRALLSDGRPASAPEPPPAPPDDDAVVEVEVELANGEKTPPIIMEAVAAGEKPPPGTGAPANDDMDGAPAAPARPEDSGDAPAWLAALPCGVVVLDADGAGLQANPAALALLGAADLREAARLLGDDWSRLSPTGANGKAIAARARPPAQALRDKAVRGQTIRIARIGDGRHLWLRCDCGPWRRHGRLAGVVVNLVNVTGGFSRGQRKMPGTCSITGGEGVM